MCREVWTVYLRDGNRHDNGQQCLDSCGDGDSLASHLRSGYLAEDHEADRANGKVIAKVPDEHQR